MYSIHLNTWIKRCSLVPNTYSMDWNKIKDSILGPNEPVVLPCISIQFGTSWILNSDYMKKNKLFEKGISMISYMTSQSFNLSNEYFQTGKVYNCTEQSKIP